MLVLLTGLAGCGFQPLFRHSGPGPDLAARFHSIEIGPIPERAGQRLRNALHDDLTPRGQPQTPVYRLNVSLQETHSALAILRDASPTLARLRLVAHYQLVELATGRTIHAGRSESTTVFKIVESEFANISAKSSALARTAAEISNDMRVRLGAFLRSHHASRQ